MQGSYSLFDFHSIESINRSYSEPNLSFSNLGDRKHEKRDQLELAVLMN